jgi:N-acetylglucosamine-6-sulfatase
MKRIVAVLVSVASAIALLFFGSQVGSPYGPGKARAQTAPGRPNIVFVLADDMPKKLSRYMPTLQGQVQARGTTFKNAYVTQSLCCPSRATILTGKYPHNHGITGNLAPNGGETEFRSTGQDQDTVATRLRAAGYRTALIGRYMNDYQGAYEAPGWSYWYARHDGANKVTDNGRVLDLTRPFPVEMASKTQGFLDRATDQSGDPPFMLFYWTPQPHVPANVPSGYTDPYPDSKLPRPPSFDEPDVSDKPDYIKNLPNLTQEQIDGLEADHKTQLGNLAHLDRTLANMLSLLRDRGELSNTYFVFASDNGTHMGQHRYLLPRGSKSTPYEEAASVPLMVRGPGVPRDKVRPQLASNNDLAATFASWAGVSPPSGGDGRSLKPLLSAMPPSTWRTALLNERSLLEPDDAPTPNYEAVFTASGERYTEYATGEKELYDLDNDPYELDNAFDPDAPQTALASRLQALGSCARDACRRAENGP